MFRYMALTWNETDAGASAAARLISIRLKQASPEWEDSLELPGLTVFHADIRPGSSDVHLMADGRGVVLGKLFKSSSNASGATGDICLENETSEIARTRG